MPMKRFYKNLVACFFGCVLYGIFFATTEAMAATINCKAKLTQTEKLICSDPVLKGKDRDLADLFFYRTTRWNVDGAEIARLEKDQRTWLKNERDRCRDAQCIDSAYDKRIAQLTITDMYADWDTDGYWYFFARQPAKGEIEILALAEINGTDVLVTAFHAANILINAKRVVQQKEVRETRARMLSPAVYGPPSFCKKISLTRSSDFSPRFNDPTNERIILKDEQGHLIRSFSILKKLTPPRKIEGVLREDHEDSSKSFLLPIYSIQHAVAVLSDCTLIVDIGIGIVRFDSQGQTKAPIPTDMLVVDDAELSQLENEFFSSQEYRERYGMSLEAKMWFFYRRLFEKGVQ